MMGGRPVRDVCNETPQRIINYLYQELVILDVSPIINLLVRAQNLRS